MIEISVTQVQRRFSSILKRVENGETFHITRRGKIVAVITPCLPATKNAYAELRELQKKNPLGTLKEILEWKNEGRR